MITSAGALFFCTITRRYLFLLRDNHKYANTWCFPGGKINKGETTLDGLMREIYEELGIFVPYDKIIPLEKFTSDDNKFEYHTYVITTPTEFLPRLNYEHKGFCWTSLDGWPMPVHPGVFNTLNEQVIKEKLKGIESTY